MNEILKGTILAALAAAALVVVIAAFRQGRGIRTLLRSAAGGVASLLAVAAVGHFTVYTLAVNAYSLLCAAVLGVPGVLLMWGVRFFWGV